MNFRETCSRPLRLLTADLLVVEDDVWQPDLIARDHDPFNVPEVRGVPGQQLVDPLLQEVGKVRVISARPISDLVFLVYTRKTRQHCAII